MPLTSTSLDFAIEAIALVLETEQQSLNELDGTLGDGDLGITLQKAFKALNGARQDLPQADIGTAFIKSAGLVVKVSSSSFGTLMATAFIAAGKQAKGREDLAWDELAGLLSAARDAVMARGKAGLGNKTVVDALDAAAHAAVGQSDPDTLRAAVLSGVNDRIVALRSTPAQIGRARIFAERSIGMDDPGMIAFRTMVEALGQR